MRRAALVLAVIFVLTSAGAAFAELSSKEGEIKTPVKSGKKTTQAAKTTQVAKKPEAAPKDDKKTELKTVRGKVVGAMKRSLSLGLISNDPEAPAEEMLLPINTETQLLNFKTVSDLRYGDGVKVDYEIIFREDKNTKERSYVSTTAKRITLIQKAKTGPGAEGSAYVE